MPKKSSKMIRWQLYSAREKNFSKNFVSLRNRRLQNVADSIVDVIKSIWTESLNIQNAHKPSG